MLKIKPTEKALTIIMIVLLVVTVLGGGFANYYFYGKLGEKGKLIGDLTKQRDDGESKRAQISTIDNKIEEIKPRVKKLTDSIPTFSFLSEYDNLAELINQIAKESGVVISESKFKIAEPGKAGGKGGGKTKSALPSNVNQIDCEIKVKGLFFQILKFVNLIETNDRFLLLENIGNMTVAGGSSGEPAPFDLRVNIKTYSYKGASLPQPKVTPTAGKTTPLPD